MVDEAFFHKGARWKGRNVARTFLGSFFMICTRCPAHTAVQSSGCASGTKARNASSFDSLVCSSSFTRYTTCAHTRACQAVHARTSPTAEHTFGSARGMKARGAGSECHGSTAAASSGARTIARGAGAQAASARAASEVAVEHSRGRGSAAGNEQRYQSVVCE